MTKVGNKPLSSEELNDSQRFAAALASSGKTQDAVAAEVGVTQSAVGQWAKGMRRIPLARVISVARAVGVDPDEISLQFRQTIKMAVPIRAYAVKSDEDGPEDGEVSVPVFDIYASAGNGALIPEFVETKFKHTFRREFFQKHNVKPDDVRVFSVTGSSMEPVLWDGDKGVMNLKKNRIQNGKVYAFITGDTGDELRVKRLFKMTDGRIRIVSDNPDKMLYPDEYVDDLTHLNILGRVIDRSGSGGLG